MRKKYPEIERERNAKPCYWDDVFCMRSNHRAKCPATVIYKIRRFSTPYAIIKIYQSAKRVCQLDKGRSRYYKLRAVFAWVVWGSCLLAGAAAVIRSAGVPLRGKTWVRPRVRGDLGRSKDAEALRAMCLRRKTQSNQRLMGAGTTNLWEKGWLTAAEFSLKSR